MLSLLPCFEPLLLTLKVYLIDFTYILTKKEYSPEIVCVSKGQLILLASPIVRYSAGALEYLWNERFTISLVRNSPC